MKATITNNKTDVDNRKPSIIERMINMIVFTLIVYEGWYIQKFGAIPYLLQILTVLLIGFTLLKELPSFTGKLKLTSPATGWFFFGMIALFVVIIKSHRSEGMDALFTYVSFWAVCVCIGIACKQDDALIRKSVLMVIVLSVVSVLLNGYAYKNGIYYGITLGSNNNPNTLALTMAIGIYYVLNPNGKATYLNWALRLFGALMCLYVALQTGSRSGVLCCAITIALTVFFYFLAYDNKSKSKIVKRFFVVLIVFVFGSFLWDNLNNIDSGTTGIHRIVNEFRAGAFSGRTNLYKEAWEVFIQNPIFGIGYKSFERLSNIDNYTHSTYMELLSCTGLVGFALFLYPCARAVFAAWNCRKLDRGRSFVILTNLAVSGLFGIIYYNLFLMAVLYYEIIRVRALEAGEINDKIMCA